MKPLTSFLLQSSVTIGVRSAPGAGRQWPDKEGWREDSAVADVLREKWISDGYVVMNGVFDPDALRGYNGIVARVRASVEEGKDEYGFGERIGQLHQKETELLELAADTRIIQFLTWALGEQPVLFGSLNFERGTQQEAHVDAIFFWPEPAYCMAGVWIALEDVHPDAGPVFYVPGSHMGYFPHSEDVVATRPALAEARALARDGKLPDNRKAEFVGQLGNAWTSDFLAANEFDQTKRLSAMLKAGDVLVWHSLLAHGGSPRNNPSLSRRSAVFHFFGTNAKLYTAEQFALYGKNELAQQPSLKTEQRSYGNLRYMHFPYFVSYAGGREIMHSLF
jgi:ectoine hydroxylase-related dioxygenase (phytanoyl-CoA dioxygenase family)